jgi:DNA-binding NarL/FixJ family response regulator
VQRECRSVGERIPAREESVRTCRARSVHDDNVILLTSFASCAATAPVQPLDPLTAREEAVLLTLARGCTNTETGQELPISMSTVKIHLASLVTKLAARNRVEFAIWAYETGRVR